MKKARVISWEVALYAIALGLALLLRLLNLGAQPLSESEAAWAMNALAMARPPVDGVFQAFDPHPAYLLLTGWTFQFFGATDFTARMWPALAGAALAGLPWFFRTRLGRPAALVMAFGLAGDPLLATFSRQAGGPMLAIAFSLFALALWEHRQPVWAGVLAGFALLSGPALYFGLAAYTAAWAVQRIIRRRQTGEAPPVYISGEARRFALVALLVTLTFAGTAFLSRPGLLAAGVGGATTFLKSWLSRPPLATPAQLFAALLAYQPLALIFALVALGSWMESRMGWSAGKEYGEAGEAYPMHLYRTPRLPDAPWLLLLFGAALLLAVFYPARLPSDLAWALPPLWAAAALYLGGCFPEARPHPVSFLHSAIVLIMLALLWLWLSSTETLLPLDGSIMWILLRPAIVVGILALLALVTALFALGWNWSVARDGLVWGMILAYLVYGAAALSQAGYLQLNQPQTLLSLPPGPGQARLFAQTLAETSNGAVGLGNQAEVTSLVETASMRWELRNFPNATFQAGLIADQQPAIVITYDPNDTPRLAESYHGQDFVWWTRPGWEGALPPNLAGWWAYRTAPVAQEKIILWVRNDIFTRE